MYPPGFVVYITLALGNIVHPSERINHIKEISKELSKEEWGLIDLTLKQFSLPYTDSWNNSDREAYVMEMISDAEAEPLLELAKHLGVASQLEALKEPSFWSNADARVFLSHLAIHKKETSALQLELRKFGISSFVAHEDIEPTKQWQTEIESALSTTDALVALLAFGFKESNWCDQEIGVAIGRQIPIIAVRNGLDPYGFIGKYQALQGVGKSTSVLAKEIFDLFIEMPVIGPKITAVLVNTLINSDSFDKSKRIIGLIKQSEYVTKKQAAAMKIAIKENTQIAGSWGVPEQIKEIAEEVES